MPVLKLEQEKIHLEAILLTHGHGDHIGAVDALRDAMGAKLWIHAADAPMLSEAKKNLSVFMGFSIETRPADHFLTDGQMLSVAGISLQVFHTPGHTPGGVCFYLENILFSGDSLFAESVGRCDFPGASSAQLIAALQEKIMCLPDETKVYPGHGPATSIGWERLYNPYLQN